MRWIILIVTISFLALIRPAGASQQMILGVPYASDDLLPTNDPKEVIVVGTHYVARFDRSLNKFLEWVSIPSYSTSRKLRYNSTNKILCINYDEQYPTSKSGCVIVSLSTPLRVLFASPNHVSGLSSSGIHYCLVVREPEGANAAYSVFDAEGNLQFNRGVIPYSSQGVYSPRRGAYEVLFAVPEPFGTLFRIGVSQDAPRTLFSNLAPVYSLNERNGSSDAWFHSGKSIYRGYIGYSNSYTLETLATDIVTKSWPSDDGIGMIALIEGGIVQRLGLQAGPPKLLFPRFDGFIYPGPHNTAIFRYGPDDYIRAFEYSFASGESSSETLLGHHNSFEWLENSIDIVQRETNRIHVWDSQSRTHSLIRDLGRDYNIFGYQFGLVPTTNSRNIIVPVRRPGGSYGFFSLDLRSAKSELFSDIPGEILAASYPTQRLVLQYVNLLTNWKGQLVSSSGVVSPKPLIAPKHDLVIENIGDRRILTYSLSNPDARTVLQLDAQIEGMDPVMLSRDRRILCFSDGVWLVGVELDKRHQIFAYKTPESSRVGGAMVHPSGLYYLSVTPNEARFIRLKDGAVLRTLDSPGGSMRWAETGDVLLVERAYGLAEVIETIIDVESVISGQVLLGDAASGLRGTRIKIHVYEGSTYLETREAFLSDSGHFVVNVSRRARLNLRIFAAGHLSILANANSTRVRAFNFTARMLAGDVDGDNYIGSNDYILFNKCYDTSEGEPGFDPLCDFDGDGYIGTNDYLLLSKNFDRIGT